jgi:hypothetical protein
LKILAALIERRLRKRIGDWGYCAIYEHDLQRIWPLEEKNRRAKIAEFAKQHGIRLVVYRKGVCAIFEKE